MRQDLLPRPLQRQSVLFPLAGTLLAAGAPLGLIAVRRFLLGHREPIREDLRRDRATYTYLAASTTVAFTVLGYALGRYADRLADLSSTDGLTGLLNPRAFHAALPREIERSRRSGLPLTLILLDLDYLKALNDWHGHVAGDRALQRIARAIRQELRSIDLGARLGGDEFAFLAIGTDEDAGRTICDRLQATIAGRAGDGLDVPITASLGVVTYAPRRDRLEDVGALMRAADQALYQAKRAGRNCVAAGSLEPHDGAHDGA